MPGQQAISSQMRNQIDNDPMSFYMSREYGIRVGDGAKTWFADRSHELFLHSDSMPTIELPKREKFSVDALVGKLFELHQTAKSRNFQNEHPEIYGRLIDAMGEYEYNLSRPDYLKKIGRDQRTISRNLLEKSLEHTLSASEILGESRKRDARAAYCLTDLGRYDEAIPVLEHLRLEAGKNHKIRSALALSYVGAGRFDDGINEYIGILAELTSGNNQNNFNFGDFDDSMQKAFYIVWGITDKDTRSILSDIELLYQQMILLWNKQRSKEGTPPRIAFNLISFSEGTGFNKFREALSNQPA